VTKFTPLLMSPSLSPWLFLPHLNPQMAVSLWCEFCHSSHRDAVCQTLCYTVRFTFCLSVHTLYEAPIHCLSRLSIRHLNLMIKLRMSYSVIDGLDSSLRCNRICRLSDIIPRCREIFNVSFSENFHENFTLAKFHTKFYVTIGTCTAENWDRAWHDCVTSTKHASATSASSRTNSQVGKQRRTSC